MSNLATTYLGLPLVSPIIIGSSTLTNSAEKIKELADAGAGAVVLKSLFEEQILGEHVDPAMADATGYHTEALEYVTQMSMAYGPQKHLDIIRKARQLTDIPIIASINALNDRYWAEFATKIEQAGASAIELNISHISSDATKPCTEFEKRYVSIVRKVKEAVSIPVAVKLGRYFTSIPSMVRQLELAGADGVVLFNRFYQIDIDIEKLSLRPGYTLSPQSDTQSLRWVSIVSGTAKVDVCGSLGIYSGKDVVKHLLAGAKAVQMTSVVLKKGAGIIKTSLEEVQSWMERHNFETIPEYTGMLSQQSSDDPEAYERQQYIKAYVGIE